MKNRKVVVAMSGGVDSSVAAAILKNDGWDVIGITLNIWPSEQGEFGLSEGKGERQCCALGAVEDARRVAGKLEIPHYVLNYRDIFNRTVVEDFCREYAAGRTPNPCNRCNQWIKFGVLMSQALSLGASALATGHYARVGHDASRGRWILSNGLSEDKDQTYALYSLTQWQLQHSLFPLGEMTKDQTREFARRAGLGVSEKLESQDICFVDNDYASFIRNHAGTQPEPGPIVSISGELLGRHNGLIGYTIGQRKGLGVSLPEPVYVVSIDAASNTLVVGSQDQLLKETFTAEECNWIAVERPQEGMKVSAQTRYRMKPLPATITSVSDGGAVVTVRFDNERASVAPGQAAVLLDGHLVVGGGILRA